MLKIRIDAVPVAQPRQRHRIVSNNGKVFATNYTPKNDPVNVFKAACQMTVAALQLPLFSEPILVDLVFVMPRPKKFDAKKYDVGRIPFARKPDRDNLEKSACDALNGLLWSDDSIIYDGRVAKFYAAKNEMPHLEITVKGSAIDGP